MKAAQWAMARGKASAWLSASDTLILSESPETRRLTAAMRENDAQALSKLALSSVTSGLIFNS